MLTYLFEKSAMSLYEQAYRFIRDDIVSGLLKAGEKLPSKRTFARNNGISTITVQNAYDQLIGEGYIYTLPRKGYYVANIRETGQGASAAKAASPSGIKLPDAGAHYDFDLSNNKVNPEHFPFSVWARISREVISRRGKELMEVPPSGGVLELREAIAGHLKSFRGMTVDPNQIVIGAGTEYLYGLLIQLLGSDKTYCIENPGYRKLVQIYAQHKVRCTYADMDGSGITSAGLYGSGAAIAHISPNHHFPTGITMSASRRYEVLAWANEGKDRYIIEDDYDSEFRTKGRPLPTLFSIDAFGKVIYINTFSKSLAPTIRISYMVLPVHLINRYYEQLSFYSCTVSNFEQYTLATFISKGFFEKHINRMRIFYSRQREQLIESLGNSRLRGSCEILENDSGLHFLAKFKTELSDRELTDRLKRSGIRMQALSDCYFTGERVKEHYFIVNYSNIDSGAAADIFGRIYECIGP